MTEQRRYRYRHGWIPIDPITGEDLPHEYYLSPIGRKGEPLMATPDLNLPNDRPATDAGHALRIAAEQRTAYRYDLDTNTWHDTPVATWRFMTPNGGHSEDYTPAAAARALKSGISAAKKYDRAAKHSETGSAKIDKIVDHARSHGLEVKITKDQSYGANYIDLEIRRPEVEVKTALDMVNNSDWISMTYKVGGEPGKPVAPKLIGARKYGYGQIEPRNLKATEIVGWFQVMGDGLKKDDKIDPTLSGPIQTEEGMGILWPGQSIRVTKQGHALIQAGVRMQDGSTWYTIWRRLPADHQEDYDTHGNPIGIFEGRKYEHVYDAGGLEEARVTVETAAKEAAP